jgi:hypothetical protein
MSMNLGINLVEVDGKAAQSIQGAATSVVGFVVRSRRGVPGQVRQVTSYMQFVEYFGEVMDGAYGAFALRGFFDNGGAMAYVVRAVDDAVATAASHAFLDKVGGTAVLTASAAYKNKDDPGSWGKDLSVTIETGIGTSFNLVVSQKNAVTGKTVQVERWDQLDLSAGPASDPKKIINDELVGSKFIKVATTGTVNPMAVTATALGTAGLEDSADAAKLVALLTAPFDNRAFDAYDVQLLCCPESADAKVISAGLTYAALRQDCMFVGHTSSDEKDTADAATKVGTANKADKVYGALYFPYIRVADPRGGTKWVPPTGHVLGVYARTEQERGIWKAPAGNAAHLAGALDIYVTLNDTQHTDLVKTGGVNAVRFIAGQGIVIDSSRTLSTNVLWLYVNVRLLFNYVKSSLKRGLRWVVQEPNDPALWAKVRYNTVTPFLMGLWRRGAFGPGAPDKVFTIKVDAENNPPENVKQGLFNVEVYFYPSRPAETVLITVGQQDSGASASES